MNKKTVKKEERDFCIKRLNIRLTEKDYKKIHELAELYTDSNVKKLVLQAVFEKPIKVVQVNNTDRGLLQQLKNIKTIYNNIGINYNQVVKKINIYENPKVLEEMLKILQDKTDKLNQLSEAILAIFNNNQKKW